MAQLLEFGRQNFKTILWGGWLQAVAPVFIVLFAFALVYLSGATNRLVGWMTFWSKHFDDCESCSKITFYFCALFKEPSAMGPVALDLFTRFSIFTLL
jgi:hypothetical protein